jgi:polyphosphate kinase 2 (PPK2 family)
MMMHQVPCDGTPSKKELGEELVHLVDELDALQQRLFADQRFAVLAVFQAMDAAGKDSTMRFQAAVDCRPRHRAARSEAMTLQAAALTT